MKFIAYVIGICLILSIFGAIGAVCWTYTINTWLVYAGKEAVVLWWHGFFLGFTPLVGQLSIPAAVTTWIIMLFLV
jgi:hypothetical protein